MDKLAAIEREHLRSKVPVFTPGDTVRVHLKVVEGGRERIQAFEGIVIGRKSGGARETFTVRRISHGVGVERTFPLHSPRIDKIQVSKRATVRRSKLYYLRDLVGKAARLKEKRITAVPSSGEPTS